MNLLSVLIMAAGGVLCILFRSGEDQVLVSMLFAYLLRLVGFLYALLYSVSSVEMQMVSVGRCFKFLEIA